MTKMVTVEVTEEQAAVIEALLGEDLDTTREIMNDYLIKEKARQRKRAHESLPLKSFRVQRQLDAYVVHEAVVQARTKDEAYDILHNESDNLFNLDEEGEVLTYDDVSYSVEEEVTTD